MLEIDRFVISSQGSDGRFVIEQVTGIPVPWHEVGAIPDLAEATSELAAEDLRSALLTPVGAPGNPIAVPGALGRKPAAFTRQEVKVLRRVAETVAHAIPYARLYARHRRLASEARLLASTSRAATAGLDIRALAQRCLTMVRDRTPFDRATLREVVPEGVWLRVRPGLLPRAAPRVSRRALISRSGHRPRRIYGCRRGTFLSRAKA